MDIVIHGRSGVDVQQLSHDGDEAEILVEPGQDVEVLRRRFDASSGRWSLELREVGP